MCVNSFILIHAYNIYNKLKRDRFYDRAYAKRDHQR
jgi:hypothetical protein